MRYSLHNSLPDLQYAMMELWWWLFMPFSEALLPILFPSNELVNRHSALPKEMERSSAVDAGQVAMQTVNASASRDQRERLDEAKMNENGNSGCFTARSETQKKVVIQSSRTSTS